MTDEQIESALKAFKQSHKDEAAVKWDTVGKGPTIHERLVETAKECGIDAAGMTEKQIEAALDAYKQSIGNAAEDKGITIRKNLVETAKKCGIDITGMSNEQIEVAFKAYKQNHSSK